MTQLRQRMLSDLQLKGMSERSQQIYIRGVIMLAEYFNKSPDLLILNDIRNYFLYLKNVKKYSLTALKISYFGLWFFYTVTLNWDVNSFNFFKLPREKKLPAVLNKKEVRKILSLIRLQCYHSCKNRHCPKCQYDSGKEWLEKQLGLLLHVISGYLYDTGRT